MQIKNVIGEEQSKDDKITSLILNFKKNKINKIKSLIKVSYKMFSIRFKAHNHSISQSQLDKSQNTYCNLIHFNLQLL